MFPSEFAKIFEAFDQVGNINKWAKGKDLGLAITNNRYYAGIIAGAGSPA